MTSRNYLSKETYGSGTVDYNYRQVCKAIAGLVDSVVRDRESKKAESTYTDFNVGLISSNSAVFRFERQLKRVNEQWTVANINTMTRGSSSYRR